MEKTANEDIQAAEKGFGDLGKATSEAAKVLTMDDIESVDDIVKEFVHIPEWGGGVWVFGLTSKERDAFEQTIVEVKGKNTSRNMENLRARLCARCIRTDETGEKRMFKKTNIEKLGNKSAKAVDRIFTVAQKLSGMSTEDVDELVKN